MKSPIDTKNKSRITLILNIFLIVSIFTISLVVLPQELFFVVAVIILVALRDIEKDVMKSGSKRFPMFTQK